MISHPYRLGFAVKILSGGGMKTHDSRRWQSGPHLSRSLELFEPVLDHLAAHEIAVFRLSSSFVPYGTHPDLPDFDYRRQLESCAAELERLGERSRAQGVRLSTHPGQYSVLNALDETVAAKARADLEQDAALLDALGQGEEGVVVIHVGGVYGDKQRSLERWARAYELLSDAARRRVVVEHDETAYDVDDVLWLHVRTGVRVVFDWHHDRCNPSRARDAAEAFAAAYETWPTSVRPKVHLSSPRTELRTVGSGRSARLVAPLLDQHADFVSPWDAAALLSAAPGPVDVMLEAKAKDLALLWLRDQLRRVAPDLAAAEDRPRAGRAASRRAHAGRSPARMRAR